MNAYDKRVRGAGASVDTEMPMRQHPGQGRLHVALAHSLGVDILGSMDQI